MMDIKAVRESPSKKYGIVGVPRDEDAPQGGICRLL